MTEEQLGKLEALSKPPVPEPKPQRRFVSYKLWMMSPGWKKIRNAKLKEAGYRCQMCGTAKNLQVHHITYKNVGCEPLDDLLVVCERCHKELHEEDLKRK